MTQLIDDLKWALRALLKTPAFTLLVVVILALGIGANAAIFTLVNRILLRPLPYPHPEQLVAVWESVPEKNWLRQPFSGPDLEDWRRGTTQLDGMAALASRTYNLTGSFAPERVQAGRVSWNFFTVVGVQPALGRGFLPEEDGPSAAKVVILSHEFWARRFQQAPALVGQSLHMDGEDWLVVGIMPKGFNFDHQVGGCEVYVPMSLSLKHSSARGSHFMPVVGRLKPGASVASAQEEFVNLAKQLEQAYPEENKGVTARVLPLKEELTRNNRNILLVLLGAVAFVLLIACANIMNLMLARGARRERETAIRAALGATRGRLTRQSLLESALLGLTGGALGLLFATWTLAAFKGNLRLVGADAAVTLDLRVLAFTFGLTLLTTLLSGLVPALQYRDGHLGVTLKEGAKGSGGRAQQRLRGLLVAAEMALATTLLIGSGLMLRSLWKLTRVDPGFQSARVLVASVGLPSFRYTTAEARIQFTRDLLRRVAELPGVEAAGASDTPPLGGSTRASSYDVEGLVLDSPDAVEHMVSPGFFRAMGIPILRGQDFDPAGSASAIVSQAFARRHWPDGDALGKRISTNGPGGPWRTIVGVVGNVRHTALAQAPVPEMYFSMLETPPDYSPLLGFSLLLKTTNSPESATPALRRVLQEIDPNLPLGNPVSLARRVARSTEDTQVGSTLLTAFAVLALGLAGMGIYGVISFLTAGRAREIGVRMALGAQVRDVLQLVIGQGLAMVLAGLGVGLVAALALSRSLETVLVDIRPQDPWAFLGAAAVLLLASFLACLVPAWRSAKIHPASALRND